MRKHRLLKWIFTAALMGLMTLPAAAFSDIEGHPSQEAIEKWSQEYQILQGYEDGTFQPDQPITRGAFAGILDRFLKFQNISAPETFSDTSGIYWEEAILKLHAANVYLGNNGKALAGSNITRQQAVTMVARAFHIEAEVLDLPYADVDQIAPYAQGPIAEMTARGYITDCENGYFRPLDPITRAEFLQILDNMLQTLISTPELYSQNVEGSVLINSAEGATLEDMTISGDLILAPGVQGRVVLTDVEVGGEIRNFSLVEPEFYTDLLKDPQRDPIRPAEVYTPGATTGEAFYYDGKAFPVYAGVDKASFSEGDFVWNEDRLEYTGDAFDTRFGIDISAFQNRASENETIDWTAVRNDGVDFAMVRVGFRGTSTGSLNADAYYKQNIEGAMAAGIETGVYFFAQAITVEEAIEEAEFVLELLRDVEINGPVAYDWEMHDSTYRVYGTAPEMATACAVAFCERLERAGYDTMVYAGQYVSYIKYDQGAIAPYLSWYPEYLRESSETLLPSFYYQMDYWQFSDRCTIDGIGGRVDGNLQFIRK